jgi:Tol biopolymer transport system component
MALDPGSRLGPYEIISLLGAGGMGEVYRAEDTRLSRTVAIKVLPEHLSGDQERRERLEREAKAVSALQHTHICTLFDIGSVDGVTYLVMEHLEGETLADRLSRGALPIDDALRFGGQIASALAAAHGRGIVHRDLKPGNIMLTPSGVKLLDFGLAKVQRVESDGDADSNSPTEAKPLTEEGSLLGTVPYMAPEQLEGREADTRSDIFALGAVLYEMVTGRRAFEGTSQASIIGAIMNGTPRPVRELEPQSPPLLDRTISKCLAKSPRERFQCAHDVVTAIEWARVPFGNAQPAAHPPRQWQLLGWVAIVAAAIAAFVLIGNRSVDDVSPTLRMVVNLPEGHELQGFFGNAFDVSPNGRQIAFTSADPTKGVLGQVFLRDLETFESRPLTEPSNSVTQPAFSPDGHNIAFARNDVLYKMSIDAGAPRQITSLDRRPNGLAWMEDGSLIVGGDGGLQRVTDDRGVTEQLTKTRDGESGHWAPRGLPGDRGVIFTVASNESSIAVLPAGAIEPRVLASGENAFYMESGHLVFASSSSGRILTAPFDLETLELTGPPVEIADHLAAARSGRSGSLYAPIAVGRNGTLAYVTEDSPSVATVWVDREGLVTPVAKEAFHTVRLSPDGQRFAADDARTGRMWIYDVVRGTRIVAAETPQSVQTPWTPDGTHIAFCLNADIYLAAGDGSAKPRLLLHREGALTPGSWSPDGSLLALVERVPDRDANIVVLSRDGRVSAFADTSADEHAPAFSPNGKWIAYQSAETGRPEVYVKPFPGPGPLIPISTNGGKAPVWSRDGTELFYREGSAMMAVSVTYEPTFTPSAPVLLFDGPYQADGTGHPSYDVAPDGRFLMMRSEPGRLSQIHVVVNLAAELASLAKDEAK